jgi:pimeloyl-ACP methyl ester carboxylesterase
MIALLMALACAPTDPGEILIEADASRDGADGADGPWGAALVTVQVQARVTEGVRVEVVFPADEEGWPVLPPSPVEEPGFEGLPALVFVHGGLVSPERYRWLAAHAATRGYLVLSPSHPMDLAITEVDNGRFALEGVRALSAAEGNTLSGLLAEDGPVSVAGHSLGGVVGAMQWVEEDAWGGIAMISSYAADDTPVEDRAGGPVLSIVGSEDGASLPEEVLEGLERFQEPRYYALVDGMNHYDWTDGATDSELENDGASTRELSETRPDALAVIDAWLDASSWDAVSAWNALDVGRFDGVEVSQ